jgi:hypothetical protein
VGAGDKIRREDPKRDSPAAHAESFADERGEKASACFARNDRWPCLSSAPDFLHPHADTRRMRDTRAPQFRITLGGAVGAAVALEGGDFEGERFEMFVN